MKAMWNGAVVAQAPEEKLIRIEGNWYFPPEALERSYVTDSQTHTTCFWKGEASYYNLAVNGQVNEDAVWYYPSPKAGSVARVGKDFSNYVAFWHGVTVEA